MAKSVSTLNDKAKLSAHGQEMAIAERAAIAARDGGDVAALYDLFAEAVQRERDLILVITGLTYVFGGDAQNSSESSIERVALSAIELAKSVLKGEAGQ